MKNHLEPLAAEFAGGRALWRGFVDDVNPPEVLNVRLDRRPLDTKPKFHGIADEWFLKNFGWRFRSASVLCTGDIKQAGEYGKVYRIVPNSEWIICWSPKIRDFTNYFYSRTHGFADCSNAEELLDDGGYRLGDIDGALSSGHEIMLSCQSYVVLADC